MLFSKQKKKKEKRKNCVVLSLIEGCISSFLENVRCVPLEFGNLWHMSADQSSLEDLEDQDK